MSATIAPGLSVRATVWNSPILLLGLTALIWAGHSIVGRLATGAIGPMTLTAGRWALAIVPILMVAWKDLKTDAPRLLERWPYVAAMGALGYTGFNALFYVAAHATTAINLSIIQGVVPAIVLIGAFFWLGAPVTARQAIGVAATILGVVAIACEGDPAKLLKLAFNHGDVLMAAAAVIYAAYTLALAKKPIVKPFSLLAGFALAALVTSLPLVAWEVASGGFVRPTAMGLFALAYAAIGPAFISQALFMRGVDLIGPGRAGVYVNLVPVFGAVLGVALLGEPFHLYHLLALALVAGGVWLAQSAARKQGTPWAR